MEVVIKWVPEDVQTLHPGWDLEQCEKALDNASKSLVDRSIEFGWDVLEASLQYDNSGE